MITFSSVHKNYHNVPAVRDLSLTVEAGETVVFIGPSGGGKTTALKMVNGLVQPTSGRVTVQGRPVSEWDMKALRQNIGYVIQQVGLFPHWTVARNVGILPQLAGWSRAERDHRVDELLELVDLEPASFRDRYPHELSGAVPAAVLAVLVDGLLGLLERRLGPRQHGTIGDSPK